MSILTVGTIARALEAQAEGNLDLEIRGAAEPGSGASDPGSQAGQNEQVTANDQSGKASNSLLPPRTPVA